jgi:ribosomal protein L37AE/L43A
MTKKYKIGGTMEIEIKDGAQPVNMTEEVNHWGFCPNCFMKKRIKKNEHDIFSCGTCKTEFKKNEAGELISPESKKITVQKEHLLVFNCPRCLERQAQGLDSSVGYFATCNRCGTQVTKIGNKWYGIERDIHSGDWIAPAPGEWHGKF